MQIRNLSVLAYAQGFTQWFYRASSCWEVDESKTAGFFNDAADMVQPGDIIMIADKGIPGMRAFAAIRVVGTNIDGFVTTSALS